MNVLTAILQTEALFKKYTHFVNSNAFTTEKSNIRFCQNYKSLTFYGTRAKLRFMLE